MKHNLRRFLPLTEARTRTVRAVRAWRQLLPDWTPTLDALRELDSMPREHRAAIAAITYGWPKEDARWDVLMALLEWERRQERTRRLLADNLSQVAQEAEALDRVIPMDEEYERLRRDSEVTVDTPISGMKILQQYYEDLEEMSRNIQPLERSEGKKVVQLIPKPGTPRAFTVRTLRSMSTERHPCGCVGLTHDSDCPEEELLP